jgi:hypothetical protein
MQTLQDAPAQDSLSRINPEARHPLAVQADIGGVETRRVAEALNEYLQEQAGLHGVDLS